MASIRKIEGKNGVSFKITVSMGRDAQDNQLRHYKTWKPEKPMTAKQAEREAKRIAYEFERDLLLGLQADNRQTFAQYAEYAISVMEQRGDKPQSVYRVRRQLKRINEHIGMLKLSDIRPAHLNAMYKTLAQPGENRWGLLAVPAADFSAFLAGDTWTAFGRRIGISETIAYKLRDGQRIRSDTAHKIEKALGKTDLFLYEGEDQPLAASTIRSIHGTVSAILGMAVKEMLLPYNAAERATLPKFQSCRPSDTLQPDTVSKVLQALDGEPEEYKTMVYLLAITGCRRGEIMGLKWENVLFDKQSLKIERTINYVKGIGVYEDTTKTNHVRFVPVPALVMQMLRRHKAKQSEWRLSVGDLWQDHGYVFTRNDGTAKDPSCVNRFLSDFCRRHGLPHINPHRFRHTVASVLLTSGVDVLTVSKLLGHADTSTTTDIYGHAIDEAKTKAAECVAEIMLKQKKSTVKQKYTR